MSKVAPSPESLLSEAVGIPDPTERERYVDQACGTNDSLRAEIHRLIQAHDKAGGFLEHAPVLPDGASTVVFQPTLLDLPLDTIIGTYRLQEKIGEGGMGSVYLAEQVMPVKRRVALKVIKPGMESIQVVARFEAERQALALMDHPNIARVLDGGATADGRPYFVMELVRGLPLTDYCDQMRLSTHDRLTLFIDVCRAVQHAHQKGVIHRDLKPSNILVTVYDGKAVPKVIDFGVAKAIGPPLTADAAYTAFAQLVGTPLYMSPEQAELSAVDVDTRADVYSLGVVLYQLLTGTTPFDAETLRKAGFDGMRRIIREDVPPRPSDRISTLDAKARSTVSVRRQVDERRLNRQLKGELDWVVMKALEKDRSRRYQSPAELSADVEHYLSGEPVAAHPPSTWYRMRKFVRKRKGRLAAAAVLFVALVAGVIGTSLGLLEAKRQEALADARRVEAEIAKSEAQSKEGEANSLVKFFEDKVFVSARPKGENGGLGKDVTLQNAIVASLPALTDVFKDQPMVEARLLLTLGRTFSLWGDAKTALEQRKRARAIYSEQLGPDHPNTLLSMIGLANSYSDLGRQDEALKLREETLAIQKRVLAPDHPDTLGTMYNLAESYSLVGRQADALKMANESLAVRKRALGSEHPDTLRSMCSVAKYYRALGRHADALPLLEEALAEQKRVLPPEHSDIITTMQILANLFRDQGRPADALPLFEETLSVKKRQLPPDHSDTLSLMNNLALCYAALGRRAEALQIYQEAILVRERKATIETENLVNLIELAGLHCNVGIALRALKRTEESLLSYSHAIEHLEVVLARQSKYETARQFLRNTHLGRALALEDLGRSAEAVNDWDRAIDLDDGARRNAFRIGRAKSRIRAGQVTEAVAEVADLATAVMQSGRQWYDLASVYAVASDRLPAKREEFAVRAVELFGRAIAAGWQNREAVEMDQDFKSLRERADCKKLIDSLPKSTPTPQPKK